MANVGSAYITLMPSMTGFSAKVSSEMSSAFNGSSTIGSDSGGSAGSGFTTGFAAKLGIISGLASTAFSAVGNVVSSSMSSAISRVDTLNQFPKVMQQMGFSAAESESAISKLSQGIDGLPTSLDSITSSAQSIALLTGDLSGATDTAIALNDAFLASGSSSADAERGLQQYTQMLSKGSVDLESWRTLQETMGYALRETANAMGYTGDSAVNDLYSALQSGEVTFDEFNAKLVELDTATGGFGDTAATASAGIGTSMANAQTAVVKNLANIIDAINGSGAISGFFDGVKNAVNNVGTALVPVAEALGNALVFLEENFNTIAPIVAGVAAGFVAFKTAMMITETISAVQGALTAFKTAQEASTLAQAALNAVMNANPFVLIATLIAAVVVALVTLYTTNEEFRTMVQTAWQSIQEVANAVWGAIVTFFTETVPNAFNTAGQVITNVTNALGEVISTVWNAIKTTVETAVNAISTTITTVTTAISTAWNTVWNAIKTVASTVWNGIKSVVTSAISAVQSTISSVVSAISGVWSSTWSSIKSFFTSIWNGIKSGATSGINAVYNTVTNIKSKITGFFAGAGSWLINAGASIMNGLKQGISNAIGGIINTVSGAVSKIRSYFPFSPAKKGAFSGHHYTTYSGRALMGDFADSIKASTHKVVSATAGVMSAAQNGLTADLTTAQRVSVNGNTSTGYTDALNTIESLLNTIAEKDSNAYMDTDKVSAALAYRSRISMAARGVA